MRTFARSLLRQSRDHCEGTIGDVFTVNHARGFISEAALMGTIANWTRRGAPVLFAGTVHAAAELAYRFLAGQVREVERASKALAKAKKVHAP